MLQHLSVSHFYTLCTHNLTEFLLCWRVLFCLLSFGCCPPVPPSFLCTLFFSSISISPSFISSSCSFPTTPAGIPPSLRSSLLTPFSSSFSFSCFSSWSSSSGPRPRTSSRCYHGNKSAATFKKGIFVHPSWVPNCMQNLKGGWKFSFPKMFDSYRDLFLKHLIHLKHQNWLPLSMELLKQ